MSLLPGAAGHRLPLNCGTHLQPPDVLRFIGRRTYAHDVQGCAFKRDPISSQNENSEHSRNLA